MRPFGVLAETICTSTSASFHPTRGDRPTWLAKRSVSPEFPIISDHLPALPSEATSTIDARHDANHPFLRPGSRRLGHASMRSSHRIVKNCDIAVRAPWPTRHFTPLLSQKCDPSCAWSPPKSDELQITSGDPSSTQVAGQEFFSWATRDSSRQLRKRESKVERVKVPPPTSTLTFAVIFARFIMASGKPRSAAFRNHFAASFKSCQRKADP